MYQGYVTADAKKCYFISNLQSNYSKIVFSDIFDLENLYFLVLICYYKLRKRMYAFIENFDGQVQGHTFVT